MNGNPVYQALALAFATVLILPMAVAMLAGWTPPRLSVRAAVHPYACAVLCIYAPAPLNAIPRMLDASACVVTACGLVALACVVAAVILLIRAERAVRPASKGPR
ncbi:hypothetical protein ACGFYY_12825 [Streptomyces sp. NPDC048331]|uniref:hypothetical protein n=1 Tax=Streptomyces sp. NPDC048331 TaxID=3365534 RepID=UPI00371EAA29